MYSDIVLLTIVICVAFFVRILPRLLRTHAIASDTYFHLYRAQTIRDNGFRLSEKLPRVILPHENTYPFLYHYLLALFKGKGRMWAERLTGAFFDTFNTVTIYWFTDWLIGQNYPEGSFAAVPIITASLYALSPALLRIGSGPRAFNGSPRIMGQSLYLVHIFCAILFFENGNLWYVSFSILAGALLIVTAKFAVQVLIFFGVFISLINPAYALLVLFSFIASIVVTLGKVFFVLKGQVNHSLNYVRHLQYIYLHPSKLTFRGYLYNCMQALRWLITLRPIMAISWFFSENYQWHLFVFTNITFIVFFISLGQITLSEQPIFITWCIAGVAWFIITKWKPMMFLGEGERYLEYAIYPTLLYTSIYFYDKSYYLLIWYMYCIISVIYYIIKYYKDYEIINSKYFDYIKMFNVLNKKKSGVIWPLASSWRETLYYSKFPVLYFGANIDAKLLLTDEFDLLFVNIPYPSGQWELIINKYKVKYICGEKIIIKRYLNEFAENANDFHDNIDQVYLSENLVAYEMQ